MAFEFEFATKYAKPCGLKPARRVSCCFGSTLGHVMLRRRAKLLALMRGRIIRHRRQRRKQANHRRRGQKTWVVIVTR